MSNQQGLVKNFFLKKNSDYKFANGLECSLEYNDWPTLTSATVTVYFQWGANKSCTIVTATGTNKSVYFEVAATETSKLIANKYKYEVYATISSNTFLLASGIIDLKEHI